MIAATSPARSSCSSPSWQSKLNTASSSTGGSSGTTRTRQRRVGEARHKRLQIGPVDHTGGRRTGAAPRKKPTSQGTEADVNPSELPALRDSRQVDVGRTNDLYARDIDKLVVENVSSQGDVAVSSDRSLNQKPLRA